VLELVVQEDDSCVEAWYLLAFSFFNLKKYNSAKNCCKNVQEMAIKFKYADKELEAGTLEIYNSCVKELGPDNEDDGFETVSEDSDIEMSD
jgi:hypothetical protein